MGRGVMKRIAVLFIVLCAACSSTPTEAPITIETALAIAGTKVAIEELARKTIVAQITLTQEALATNTPIPTSPPIPTNTPEPQKETFIISTGSCLGYDARYIPNGDPVGFEFCETKEKTQKKLSHGDTLSFSSFAPEQYPSFCAIHSLNGVYITSNVDIVGLGKAVCVLP
jgi:hypothetical protein